VSKHVVSPVSTIGPFFPFEFADEMSDLTKLGGKSAQGEHIVIVGRVLEEGGAPTRNSIVEIWQPDANGILKHPDDPRFAEADPAFRGFGRARTHPDGSFKLITVMPGASEKRAPHINIRICAIGVTRPLVTTIFFSETTDPVLDCVPTERRRLLVACKRPDGAYRFDVILRGDGETPFFAD
jgi:protocatechuate 3,4-dioxygenase alpha subunit